MNTTRNQVLIEATRLESFLANNQLVQAHAIAQKLENMLQRAITEDIAQSKTKAEEHRYWHIFRAAIRAKTRILVGNTEDALNEAKLILQTIKKE